MNCPNCGAVCNDSTNFCPSCGTALKQPSPEETRQETTAEVKPEAAEEVRTEAVAAEVPTSGEPAPEAPETGKKKKKSLAKKIILAVGLVLFLPSLPLRYSAFSGLFCPPQGFPKAANGNFSTTMKKTLPCWHLTDTI